MVEAAAARIVCIGVERPRETLPRVARGETENPLRAGAAREQRRFDQPLEIDRDIVPRAAQLANHAGQGHAFVGPAPAARLIVG